MMAKKEKKEVTFTEGSVFQALIRFAIPVLGALVLQAAYGAVDLLVVGQFGDASSISAVGTGSSFMNMVTFVITSLAMGSTVIIGQHIGEKKSEEAGNAVGTTIVLFLLIGVLLTVLLEIFAGDIVSLLQVPEESTEKAILYIRICSGGILVIIAYNVISGILRGIGNANLPFVFVGVACIFNILGDLFFTGLLHMDVAGVALATVLAQLISVIISAAVLRKQKMPISFSKKQCCIHARELKLILKVGVPIAIQEAMVQVSFLVINSIINQMGLLPSAGYGIAQKVVSFYFVGAFFDYAERFCLCGTEHWCGQKRKRAKQGFFTAILVGCSVGILIFCAGFFAGKQLSMPFTSDPEVIAQSAAYLKGFSADCILTCILFSSIGYFNGSGKSFPVMLQGITSRILYPYSNICFYSWIAGYFAGLYGNGNAYYHGLWYYLFCSLFCYFEEEEPEK